MLFTIISIEKNSEDLKRYFLHSNKLSEIFGPIKDKPVSIIPILGASQNENSYIMDSIISFLSDQDKTDLIGKINQGLQESLEVLKLEAGLESQTSVLRISEPFLVKKSNGNEMAVLLMDTQGLFDVNSNQRDCSTIVGISLLMSSCIILNLSNDIKEDINMKLKLLIQISAMVSTVNLGNQQKLFKELFILMSNWEDKEKFECGFSDGQNLKEFLTEDEPDVKKLLGESFEDVLFFLMPEIRDQAEEKDSEGSADVFQDKFLIKLFEKLEPKTIDNIIIKGEDFKEYFKTFVEVFNSHELSNHKTMTEAIAKIGDLIQLKKLKDSNLTRSKAFLESKPFIAQKLLRIQLNDLSIETIETFGRLKKSNKKERVNELNIILENNLKSNYDQIWSENDRNRENFISEKIENCCIDFKEAIEGLLGSQFIDPDTLDDKLIENKTKVVNLFQQSFNGEEKKLFAEELLKLKEKLETLEKGFKDENRRRKINENRLNQEAVGPALQLYKKRMNEVIDENVDMSMDKFKSSEQDVRNEAKREFEKNCSSGKSNSRNEEESEFQNKLKKLKSEFKTVLKTKLSEKKKKQENYLKVLIDDLIDEYENQMEQHMYQAEDEQALINKHKQEKDKIINILKSQLLDSQTIEFYIRMLKDKIKESFKNIKNFTILRLREQESTIRSLGLALELYKKRMNEVIDENVDISMDEFKNSEKDIRNEAKREFEKNCSSSKSNSNNEKESEFQSKLKELKSKFKNVFKTKLNEKKTKQEKDLNHFIDELVDKYGNNMDQFMDEAEDEQSLIKKHKQEKNKIISEFMSKNKLLDSQTTELYRTILKNEIKTIFGNIRDLTRIRLREQGPTITSLKNEIRSIYREEMAEYYRNRSYFSNENLTRFHELVLGATNAKFQSKLAQTPFDNYLKFVEESVEDIYNEIRIENDMNTPTVNAIGIDLGTTNSCVAYYKTGSKNQNSFVVIKDINSQKSVMPSVVTYQDGGQIIVGTEAKRIIRDNHRNTIYSIKRLIGRRFNDPSVQADIPNLDYKVVDDGQNNPKVKVEVNKEDKFYYPEEISAEVLKKMKIIAEKYFQSEQSKITKAVITVPAYFGDAQKQATKDAGQAAGFEVLKIITEPTAAALAYKFYRTSESSRKVLIYDFGGGTFDVAVLDIEKGEVNVLSIGGNNHLGGDDIDNILVNYCLDEFRKQTGISVPGEGFSIYRSRLRNKCEKSKCKLSTDNETTITLDNFYQNNDLRVNITRNKFEELTEKLFIESKDLVAKALEDSGLTNEDVDDIVLVGGTTCIPRVQEMLSKQFGGRPLNFQVNPDEAVAVGAAIQAAILNGQQAQELGYLKVREVAPMSLGVRVKGGLMSIIIDRNSKIPNIYERNYETTSDFQTEINIFVYEGENRMADQNKQIGKFKLTGIPAAPKGEQNIIVSFEITDEGILKVKAKITSTGFESEEIRIEEHRGRLTTLELEQLIRKGNI